MFKEHPETGTEQDTGYCLKDWGESCIFFLDFLHYLY